jgi:hypothetical protein
MKANTVFRDDELVVRRQKQNGQWIDTAYPKLGGRLRVLHEQEEKLSIKTEVIKLEPDFVAVRASIMTPRGTFSGTGTASSQRDARLADSLVELAESRSIARAARFAGVGVEFCGAEEVSHLSGSGTEEPSDHNKTGDNPVFGMDNGGVSESKPQHCGNDRATQAQVRALYALTKKADYSQEDLERLLIPLSVYRFEDLTRQAASQIISSLQSEVAA